MTGAPGMRVRAVGRTDEPAVVAIVLNWRRARMTLDCLSHVNACGYSNLHVIVLDNGSGTLAEEVLHQALAGGAEELRLLRQNMGYCAAMNEGLELARDRGARYVLFLNNDVTVAPGFLGPLVTALEADADLGGVAPSILRGDGKVWSQGARVGFFPNLTVLLDHGRAPAPATVGPIEADYLPGACALYRQEDLHTVGGLSNEYFMYMEDADLGLRLRRAGRTLVTLPWVRVTHDAGSSSGGARSPLRKFMMAANSLRFLRRHGSLRSWSAFLLLDVAALPLAMLRSPRAGWAKFCGLLTALRGRPLGERDIERWVVQR